MAGEGLTTDGIIAGLTGQAPEVLAANQGAATTRQRAGEIAQSGANGAHDPEYIRNMEDFKSRSHQEIYDHAQQMQPGSIHASAEAWKLIGTGMQFATMSLINKVQKSAANGWEGASADAMLAALDRFVGEMAGIQDVANGVGWRLESASLAAEAVKASVPAPSTEASSTSPIVPGLENPAVLHGSTQAASDGHQEAVWAMTNHYVPNYRPAGQNVPTFGVPTGPGDVTSVPGGSGIAGLPTSSPDSAGGSSPASTPELSNQAESLGSESAGANSGDDGSSNGDSADGAQESSSNADDDSTNAAGADTGAAVGTPSPGSPSSGGGVPGSAGHDSSGGSGAPVGAGAGSSGGQPGSGVPVAGRAVAGSPAAPGAVGGGAAGGAGSRATSGMGGMPGMAGGAGRRQGDQDGEHKGIPEWMINQRNTEELLGPRQPTTPAVFGIDAGPVRDGEWEAVRRDVPEGPASPTAFAADQSARDDWSAAPGERGERPR